MLQAVAFRIVDVGDNKLLEENFTIMSSYRWQTRAIPLQASRGLSKNSKASVCNRSQSK